MVQVERKAPRTASSRGGARGADRTVAPGSPVVKSVPPFADFLETQRTTVYRFCTAAVGPDEADDCFQEVMLAALRAYPRLENGEHLDRWVLRIASRKAIDHHRRRVGRAVPVDTVPDRPVGADARAGGDPPIVLDGALWTAVRGLPPKQRVAVVHRHVLDRPYDEIADLMGTTQEAARANVSAGLRSLKERIA